MGISLLGMDRIGGLRAGPGLTDFGGLISRSSDVCGGFRVDGKVWRNCKIKINLLNT